MVLPRERHGPGSVTGGGTGTGPGRARGQARVWLLEPYPKPMDGRCGSGSDAPAPWCMMMLIYTGSDGFRRGCAAGIIMPSNLAYLPLHLGSRNPVISFRLLGTSRPAATSHVRADRQAGPAGCRSQAHLSAYH
jgi:hypothetical protein